MKSASELMWIKSINDIRTQRQRRTTNITRHRWKTYTTHFCVFFMFFPFEKIFFFLIYYTSNTTNKNVHRRLLHWRDTTIYIYNSLCLGQYMKWYTPIYYIFKQYDALKMMKIMAKKKNLISNHFQIRTIVLIWKWWSHWYLDSSQSVKIL